MYQNLKEAADFSYEALNVPEKVRDYLKSFMRPATFLAVVRMKSEVMLHEFALSYAQEFGNENPNYDEIEVVIRRKLEELSGWDDPEKTLFAVANESGFLIPDFRTLNEHLARIQYIFGATAEQVSAVTYSSFHFFDERNTNNRRRRDSLMRLAHQIYEKEFDMSIKKYVTIKTLIRTLLPSNQAPIACFYIDSLHYQIYGLSSVFLHHENKYNYSSVFGFSSDPDGLVCILDAKSYKNLELARQNLDNTYCRSRLKAEGILLAEEQNKRLKAAFNAPAPPRYN